MTRTAPSKGGRTAAAIRRVGLRLIFRHGFGAMSLRQLAAEVGVQPASLYNHIATKQALLFDLIHDHLVALLEHCDAAVAAVAPGAPGTGERLRAFISQHLHYHLEKKQEVFVANFELRALDPGNYSRIIAMRRSYEERLIVLLDEGVAAGEVSLRDTRVTAYAILAMLTGACTWYKPDGRLTKAEMVALHTDLVLHGLQAGTTASFPRLAAEAVGEKERCRAGCSTRP